MINMFVVKNAKRRLTAGILSAFALAVLFQSCSKDTKERESVPEMTSMTDIEPYSADDSFRNIKINEEFTFRYSDYNFAESPSSQNGILVDRCIRVLSYGKSDTGSVQLVVQNEDDRDIKYAVLKCSSDSGDLSFKITSMPSGSVCVLTEDNGAEFDENGSYYGFELSDTVYFDNKMSAHSDVLLLRGKDGVISVKNISEHEVSDVYVYYKNEENGVLIGNETYRVSFGSLAPNEEKELSAEHYKTYMSRILFTEYGD